MRPLLKIATFLLLSLCAFTFAHADRNPHEASPKSKVVQAKNCKLAHSANAKDVRKRAAQHCSTRHENAKVGKFKYDAMACQTNGNSKTRFGISFSSSFICGKANTLENELGSLINKQERVSFGKWQEQQSASLAAGKPVENYLCSAKKCFCTKGTDCDKLEKDKTECKDDVTCPGISTLCVCTL